MPPETPPGPELSLLKPAFAGLMVAGAAVEAGMAEVALRPVLADADPALLERLPPEERLRYETFESPARRREWAEGRRAALEARDSLVRRGAQASDILSSVTHSGGWALAVGYAWPPRFPFTSSGGVGVDLEREDRSISEAAEARVLHRSERELRLRPIELWAIKEAAYKSNPLSAGGVVQQYRVLSFDADAREGKGEGPDFRFSFRSLRTQGWVVAFARGYDVGQPAPAPKPGRAGGFRVV